MKKTPTAKNMPQIFQGTPRILSTRPNSTTDSQQTNESMVPFLACAAAVASSGLFCSASLAGCTRRVWAMNAPAKVDKASSPIAITKALVGVCETGGATLKVTKRSASAAIRKTTLIIRNERKFFSASVTRGSGHRVTFKRRGHSSQIARNSQDGKSLRVEN